MFGQTLHRLAKAVDWFQRETIVLVQRLLLILPLALVVIESLEPNGGSSLRLLKILP